LNQRGYFADKGGGPERVKFSLFCADVLYGRIILDSLKVTKLIIYQTISRKKTTVPIQIMSNLLS